MLFKKSHMLFERIMSCRNYSVSDVTYRNPKSIFDLLIKIIS